MTCCLCPLLGHLTTRFYSNCVFKGDSSNGFSRHNYCFSSSLDSVDFLIFVFFPMFWVNFGAVLSYFKTFWNSRWRTFWNIRRHFGVLQCHDWQLLIAKVNKFGRFTNLIITAIEELFNSIGWLFNEGNNFFQTTFVVLIFFIFI